MRIGEILLKEKKITPEQLTQALSIQRQFQMRLGSVLIEAGLVDEDTIARALSRIARVPAVLRKHFEAMDRASAAKVPARMVAALQCVPLGYTPSQPPRFLVACRDPLSTQFDEIAFIAGARVEPGVASELVIRRELERTYGIKNETQKYVMLGSGRSQTVKQVFAAQAKRMHDATTAQRGNVHNATTAPGKKSRLSVPPPASMPQGNQAAPTAAQSAPMSVPPNSAAAASRTGGQVERARRSLTMPQPIQPPPGSPALPGMPAPAMYVAAQGHSAPPPSAVGIPASALMASDAGTEADFDSADEGVPQAWAPETPLGSSAGGLDISIAMHSRPGGMGGASAPMPAAMGLVGSGPPMRAPAPSSGALPDPPSSMQMPVAQPYVPPAVEMQRALSSASMPAVVVPAVVSPAAQPPVAPAPSPISSASMLAAEVVAAPAPADFYAPELRMPIDAAQALESMKAAVSRDQICNDLVDYLLSMGPVALIFIVKDDMILGWKGHVEGVNPAVFDSMMFPASAPSFFKTSIEAKEPFCGDPPPEGATIQNRLWKTMKQEAPAQVMVGPIMLKERVVNLLYTHPRKGERFIPRDIAEMTKICAAASAEYIRLIRQKATK